MNIRIDDIIIKDGRRAVDGNTVRELAESIQEIGLINPIAVNKDNILVAGAHRIEAFKLLGKEDIPATIMDVEGLHAELAEIDENLLRNEDHFIVRGEKLARRKEIYEELHPETRREATLIQNRNEIISEREVPSFTEDTSKKLGVSRRTVEQEIQISKKLTPEAKAAVVEADIPKTEALNLARMAPEQQKPIAEKLLTGEASTVKEAQRQQKRDDVVSKLEDISVLEAKELQGVYDVVVIDPPWPMQKIERDVRPNQTGFDYPTMSEEELLDLEVPCADDCHVWLWTTQKFMPMAFRLLEAWGLKYVCAFVWHKPGGFQPIGLPQYNCEFALYARRGTPSFTDTKALPACFNAPRGAHSEKPEEFYDMVRRVTSGRRVDMFNRRAIDGFDTWGKEAANVEGRQAMV